MIITIDGHDMVVTPTQMRWEPPQEIERDGINAPIFGRYWRCSLSFTFQTPVTYVDWQNFHDSDAHTVIIPNPFDGEMTTFSDVHVQVLGINMDTSGSCSTVQGMDVLISTIVMPAALYPVP